MPASHDSSSAEAEASGGGGGRRRAGARQQAIAWIETSTKTHRGVQVVQQVAGDRLVSGRGSPSHICAAGAAGGAAHGPQKLPGHGSGRCGVAEGLLGRPAERGGAPQEGPARALGEAAHCA